jgi:hypothetical protein
MKRTIAAFAFVLAISASSFAATSQPVPQISGKQLNALIASAKTPIEHQKIAAYYRAQSESYLAESNQHAKMGADFAANSATNNAKSVIGTVNHCQYLAQSLKAKSVEAGRLALEHEQMAKQAASQR